MDNKISDSSFEEYRPKEIKNIISYQEIVNKQIRELYIYGAIDNSGKFIIKNETIAPNIYTDGIQKISDDVYFAADANSAKLYILNADKEVIKETSYSNFEYTTSCALFGDTFYGFDFGEIYTLSEYEYVDDSTLETFIIYNTDQDTYSVIADKELKELEGEFINTAVNCYIFENDSNEYVVYGADGKVLSTFESLVSLSGVAFVNDSQIKTILTTMVEGEMVNYLVK